MPEGLEETSMKADWNDAPNYIRTKSRRNGAINWLVPGAIVICVSLGVLQLAGSALLRGAVQNLTNKSTHPKQVPSTATTQPEQVARKNWNRIVEDLAEQDAKAQAPLPQPQTNAVTPPTTQNVFNDQNYTPREADNVLSFKKSTRKVEEQKLPKKVRVNIVRQKPSMKDRACWPLKEGSIEHRNCRFSIGLKH